MAVVDRHVPVHFLRTLFEPTDWIAIFLKSYERSTVAQRVGPVSWVQTERFQRWLRAMNARSYNVFASVNAIASGRHSRTRDAIGAARHVFLDADNDGPAVLSRVDARRDLPSPSYILHSSPNHIHVFWRVSGFDPDAVERLQKQLARELETDPAATPVTQNTRLPGFFNHTGLRIGELLALRWSALDLDIGTLAVRESVFEGKFQRPKTMKALRTIPLGSHTVAVLSEHRDASTRTEPNDLVFGNRKGEPFRESKMLTRVLQPAAESAGLGRVTWHQFRHIHSSLLNDLRVPAKIAQEQLGHASISTTLGIYTHVVDGSHRAAVTAVEERLFGVLLRNAPKSAAAVETATAVSDGVD